MNSRDRSLEDGPSAVTKAFPCISLIIPGHFYRFYHFYGGVGLGSVGGLRGLLKKHVRLKDYFVISKSFVISWKGGSSI